MHTSNLGGIPIELTDLLLLHWILHETKFNGDIIHYEYIRYYWPNHQLVILIRYFDKDIDLEKLI